MSRWERIVFNVFLAVVSISGFGYLVMKYLLETDDPFALVNHPWQPFALDLHVISAPFLLFTAGMLARSHIRPKWRLREGRHRRTGFISALFLALMTVSGYGLQVVATPSLNTTLLVLHIGSSVTFIVFYLGHLYLSRLKRKSPSKLQKVDNRRLAA